MAPEGTAAWTQEEATEQFQRIVIALREATGLAQKPFSRAIGIPNTTLRNLEQGRYLPNLWVVVTLARFVGVPLYRVIQAWIGEGGDVADFSIEDLKRIVAYRKADARIQHAVDGLLGIVPHDPGVKKTRGA